jgi:hypothetical protein
MLFAVGNWEFYVRFDFGWGLAPQFRRYPGDGFDASLMGLWLTVSRPPAASI